MLIRTLAALNTKPFPFADEAVVLQK